MSGRGLIGTTDSPARTYDLALVDLDGVAYRAHEPIDHASASLVAAREAGMSLVFVTNNASREPEEVAAQLTELEIPTRPDEVLTAAQAAAALLATRLAPGDKVLVVGGKGLRTATAQAGFQVVDHADDEPVAVVQGFSPDLGWRQLAEAAYAVERGAWHVASNLDLSLPTDRGFAPGNGALVGAVVHATGVTPDSSGKPSPAMYELAVSRHGATAPLVVGDRLDTDLAGARAGGIPGLHVFTGVSSARDAVLAKPGERPHLLGADLRALHEPHPEPQSAAEGWWTCREAAARVVGERLELDGSGIDLVRAACAAAWASTDDGAPVDPTSVPALPA
ncbi:MAG: HAD-IIA family hydrolase [Actinomycetales bacterium]|nr:HAD-IIA family hydrolase [Actinomycetales bacterium]